MALPSKMTQGQNFVNFTIILSFHYGTQSQHKYILHIGCELQNYHCW